MKVLGLPVSKKNNLKFSFFVLMFQLVAPEAGPVLTRGASLNKLDRGPLEDATYQISKL